MDRRLVLIVALALGAGACAAPDTGPPESTTATPAVTTTSTVPPTTSTPRPVTTTTSTTVVESPLVAGTVGVGKSRGAVGFRDRVVTIAGGSIWAFDDLEKWRIVESIGDVLLTGIAAGPDRVVVAGPLYGMYVSEDGLAWELVSLPGPGGAVGGRVQATAVVAHRDGFVAAGTHIWYSADGSDWSLVVDGLSGAPPQLASDGARVIVIDRDEILTSTDGRTWASHPTGRESGAPNCPSSLEIRTVVGTPRGFFLSDGLPVLGGRPPTLWRSVDGISWNEVALAEPTTRGSGGVLAIVWLDDRVIAVGLTWSYSSPVPEGGFPEGSCPDLLNPTPAAWSSTNGVDWERLPDRLPVSRFTVESSWFTGDALRAWAIDGRVLIQFTSQGTAGIRWWTPSR